MAIVPVTRDDVENFTIVTTPRRDYHSGSSGVTGSVAVFPRYSTVSSKPVSGESSILEGDWKDKNFKNEYDKIVASARSARNSQDDLTTKTISNELSSYLSLVESTNSRENSKLEIERFVPTTNVTRYTHAKNTVKDNLMSFYRTEYPNAHWAYTNYNSLNFFTVSSGSQTIPTSSVLLYPNITSSFLPEQTGFASGTYCLSGAFTFDFHINPRYQVDGIDAGQFKAGTIFHLSSSYALSLVTGSSKDPTGKPDGFRLMLQLKHSADVSPSAAVQGAYPSDLIFLSDDNSLKFNKWHHVVVRWGTNLINGGSGSFVVDGKNKGYFVVPSGTINAPSSPNANPDVLCLGNYYEGINSGSSLQKYFFTPNNAKRYGVTSLMSSASQDDPSSYRFNHPLKAEVHDLTIKRYYSLDSEIIASGSVGLGERARDVSKYAFHLPPIFVQETNIRREISGSGGVLVTPFAAIDGTTDDPFNVSMAFTVGGHYVNLENYVKDFTNNQFGRTLNLSGAILSFNDYSGDEKQDANKLLYRMASVPKRNLTILPCDDGNFEPSYALLRTEAYTDKFTNSLKRRDWSYVNLDNLVSEQSLQYGIGSADPSLANYISFQSTIYGPTPDDVTLQLGPALSGYYGKVENSIEDAEFDRGILKDAPLPVFKNLRDPSSNQVTFFNISNLYYGRRILPGSFTLTDSAISGSEGAVKITLKDDGLGNLYRADSDSNNFTQNSVGNIFYDEGIVLIKNPHLYFFGKNQFDVSFKGVSNIYTTKYEILAGAGQLNSSSNPTYALNQNALKASGDPTDKDKFVYISGLNLHDENMNVVAKVKLAQPIIKRTGDKILFKVALDF